MHKGTAVSAINQRLRSCLQVFHTFSLVYSISAVIWSSRVILRALSAGALFPVARVYRGRCPYVGEWPVEAHISVCWPRPQVHSASETVIMERDCSVCKDDKRPV